MSEEIKIRRVPPCGMITFRGDLALAPITRAVKSIVGAAIPKTGKMIGDTTGGAAWMSPDELLLLVQAGTVQDHIATLNTALEQQHVLVADVSDARAMFRIEGRAASDVLARLCPIDLHPSSFGLGDMRRSRLGQVAVAVWRDTQGFNVICFRSVEAYVEAALGQAAASASLAGTP